MRKAYMVIEEILRSRYLELDVPENLLTETKQLPKKGQRQYEEYHNWLDENAFEVLQSLSDYKIIHSEECLEPLPDLARKPLH